MISKDPGVSLAKLSAKLKVSPTTMRRIASQDLGYQSYKIKIRQMLSQDARNKRVKRCKMLLSSIKNGYANSLKFFSDEKMFTVDAKPNSQNDRWLAHDPDEVPIVSRTKFPASVHVLGVVSSEGDVMPPHFFAKGETVNKNVYLGVLKKKLCHG